MVREHILDGPIREILLPAIRLLEENKPRDSIVVLRAIQALTKEDHVRDQIEKEVVPSIWLGNIARALKLLHELERGKSMGNRKTPV
jgi:hypothetical protein